MQLAISAGSDLGETDKSLQTKTMFLFYFHLAKEHENINIGIFLLDGDIYHCGSRTL